MSTITREQLRERAREKVKSLEFAVTQTAFANTRTELEEELALARIALASLEAEPVAITDDMAYAFHHAQSDSSLGADEVEEIKAGLRAAFANVTAPPAPVALTSGYSDFEEIWSSSTHPLTQDDEMKDFAWDIWNACRSAILQGADVSLTHEGKNHTEDKLAMVDHSGDSNNMVEHVTTGYKFPFEQWLSQHTGTIDVECGCVMTEVFFHWLRVAYEAGNSPVIPDGWVACSELMPEQFKAILAFNEYGEVWSGAYDRYWNFYCDNLLVEHVTHWMPLPAAPQQEVTQALAKGMERYGDAMQKLADSGD